MLPPEDAWKRLELHLAPLPAERLPRRAAAGRVLAESLAAQVDVPPVDVSAMDGYAVAGSAPAGARLPVAATVVAGDRPGLELAPGTAARIMTGAPVPTGADRVVPVEETDSGEQEVHLPRGTGPRRHIRRQGEVVRRGDPLLAPGALLTPGALSLLATHGFAEISVHRAPSLAVVVTGDEVVPPEAEPQPGQLRDSHSDFLLAAGRGLGLDVELLGIAGDRVEELRAQVERGLGADVLLLTGGVSMGELDLVEGVLGDLGVELLFDAVAVQPGKPLVAGVHRRGAGGLVFGLPGNPASVMVCFWLFVRPALRRLLGLAGGYWHGALPGVLAAPLPGAKGRDRFLPAAVEFAGGRIEVTTAATRGSHDLAAYSRGTALVRIPAGAEPAEPGAPCEVLPLADWRIGRS
jgi:molybdenum cofactor synthesis domain-containing protein